MQNVDNEAITEILDRSVENWLTKEDALTIYTRHYSHPFLLSTGEPGPEPRIQGLFLFKMHEDTINKFRERKYYLSLFSPFLLDIQLSFFCVCIWDVVRK